MERLRIVTFTLVLAILFGSLACRKTKTENVNLVTGITPASHAFQGIHGFAEELARLPEAERIKRINEVRPQLEQAVVYFLRGMNRIKPSEEVERIETFFGSLERVSASDDKGNVHRGYFKDELVARIRLKGGRTEDALVRCLNMLFELPRDIRNLQPLRTTEHFTELREFRIGRGQGLVHHVDYAMAIDLAARHRIPLYSGKIQSPAHLILPEEARRLESETDRVQITAGVKEGAYFNLVTNTYDPAPR